MQEKTGLKNDKTSSDGGKTSTGNIARDFSAIKIISLIGLQL